MPMVPYEPFRHLENLRREWDRYFTNDFPALSSGSGQQFGTPSVDLHETENEIVASCDLPGLESKEDVSIDIDGNVLTISGQVNRVNVVKEASMHRRERFTGRFQRSVSLPSRVSEEGVKATYHNGVLDIHMPKLTDSTRKRIDVEFH